MFNKFTSLFNSSQKISDVEKGPDEKQLATAALLIEAAASDEEFDENEKAKISEILIKHFRINVADANRLIEKATETQQNADQILYFTRTIKDNFEIDERIEVMEMLWEVAYADGTLSDYESHLIRRVAGLIYVSDKESGIVRKKVLDRINSE